MARPITRREIAIKRPHVQIEKVEMTTRQEELFNILLKAGGRVVDRATFIAEMNISPGALRVLKCELSKILRGYYTIYSVSNGGYQMLVV